MAAAAKSTSGQRDGTIVVGLGANLGDRLEALREAVRLLEQRQLLTVEARSHVFETPPAGGPPQPAYLNAAILGRTQLNLPKLLEGTLDIERALGRHRPDRVRWGPRTIDIDLLWASSGTHRSEHLVVPHPRLHQRPFALQPLLELVPDAADPATGRPYAELPAALEPIERLTRL